jgi:diketogulonate reductase-like aldo/keto reductase
MSLSSPIKLNNGVLMPRIHLGVYMTSGRETSQAVTHALEAGYRAVDSAEWYANEKEVGSAILKYLEKNADVKREDVWFTTKLKENRGYDETRKKIRESIRKSGMGYLDLYLLHSPYGGKGKRLECWRAVEDAVAEGEVRAGGVSNYGVKHVRISVLSLIYLVPNGHALTAFWRSCKNSSIRNLKLSQLSTKSKSIPLTHAQTLHPSAKSTVL